MKKNSKRTTKQKKAQIRSLVSKVHVLIAVVAIIECLILISFTTFSWIETSSSLIIETGKKYVTDANITRIPIAKTLNYKFTINSATGNDSSLADLNTYFSLQGKSTDQDLFRYARTSTANGTDYFFKRQSPANNYRKGDTADINAGYTYFDFTLSNKGSQSTHKYKFYFADVNVFNVTNGEGSNLSSANLTNIKNAMRISFQTGTGTPKIYAPTAQTYNAVSAEAGTTTSATATAIQASENQRLFTIGKNTEQKISVRIWLEEKAASLSSLTPAQISGANISVNLKLTYAQNDYDYLYFDDYTFSSGRLNKDNIGGHLTEDYAESDNYRMYFVYRTSNSATGYVYPMTIDDGGSNMDAKCWVTCDATGSASPSIPDIENYTFISNLTTANNAALNYSYFAYGKCALSTQNATTTSDYINNTTTNNINLANNTNAIYTWKLNSAGSSDEELRYNAYSATAIKSTSHSSSNQTVSASGGYGCGGWSYNTPLEMVYFRDLATGVTDSAYSAGANFQYITDAVNTASDNDGSTSTHRNNVMFVNQASTVATSMTETLARATATMYYDKGLDGGKGLFKSWVPSAWLTSGSRYFHYCSGTYYNNTTNCYSVINWNAPTAAVASGSSMYIYTGLGYSETGLVSAFAGNTTGATGVGCWNAIESQPINFSTELIDNSVTSAFRYQIGINITTAGAVGTDTSAIKYYNLIPDETMTKFYAYVPVPGTITSAAADYVQGSILFRSYTAYNGTQNATWYGKVRSGSRTYYPVAFNTTSATSTAPKGYWNLGVIVDGTYEHFFWVPTTIATVGGVPTEIPAHILGKFYYNTTGHSGSPTYTEITPNQIDEYRWYVPLDSGTVGASIPGSVYFKWIPYAGSDGTFGTSDDTVFTYSLYISDGIYCVITEAADETPANAFN